MKRDPELIRIILLKVEDLPIGQFLSNINIDGYDHATIAEHVRLLTEAEYIDAKLSIGNSRFGVSTVAGYSINRLLNNGHDFIAAAKNDSIWKTARNEISDKVGDVSLAVLKAVLAKTASQMLGL